MNGWCLKVGHKDGTVKAIIAIPRTGFRRPITGHLNLQDNVASESTNMLIYSEFTMSH